MGDHSVDRFNSLATWEAAFAYEAAGLRIIPLAGVSVSASGLRCSCFLGKRCPSPAKHAKVPWGPMSAFQTEPFTWWKVANWWHPEYGYWPSANIGLPTGVNGLAVLDVDVKHDGIASLERLEKDTGLTLTDTFIQETGSGGWHLIFAAPPGGIKSDSESFGPEYPGLDTRGRGGLIVAAPSRHVSGGKYAFRNVMEPAPWPEDLTKLMIRPGGELNEVVPVVTIPAFVRGLANQRREHISQMEEATEGSRNALLNQIAFWVAMDGGTDEDFELLRRVAEDVGLNPTEVVKTIDSGRSAALRGALEED